MAKVGRPKGSLKKAVKVKKTKKSAFYQKKIKEYFDVDKEPSRKITLSGLIHYMGFKSMQAFNKELKEDDSLGVGKLLIQKYYEEGLKDKFAVGSIFALKTMDWRESKSDDDFQNNFLTLLVLFNKYLLQSNAELASQMYLQQEKFVEILLRASTKEHLELLIDKQKLIK